MNLCFGTIVLLVLLSRKNVSAEGGYYQVSILVSNVYDVSQPYNVQYYSLQNSSSTAASSVVSNSSASFVVTGSCFWYDPSSSVDLYQLIVISNTSNTSNYNLGDDVKILFHQLGSGDSLSAAGLNHTSSNSTIAFSVKIVHQSNSSCSTSAGNVQISQCVSASGHRTQCAVNVVSFSLSDFINADPVRAIISISAYILVSMIVPTLDLLFQGWRGRTTIQMGQIWIGNVCWVLLGFPYVEFLLLVTSGLACMAVMVLWPLGRSILRFALMALLPFGRASLWRSKSDISGCDTCYSTAWHILLGGIFYVIAHLTLGVAMCVTVIMIPLGLQHFKLAKLALGPQVQFIVSSHTAIPELGRRVNMDETVRSNATAIASGRKNSDSEFDTYAPKKGTDGESKNQKSQRRPSQSKTLISYTSKSKDSGRRSSREYTENSLQLSSPSAKMQARINKLAPPPEVDEL